MFAGGRRVGVTWFSSASRDWPGFPTSDLAGLASELGYGGEHELCSEDERESP